MLLRKLTNRFLSAFLLSCLLLSTAQADEGMWLLMKLKELNEAEMQRKGLKLSAEEIYSINKSSLKDAIVSLGGFCTAEIISKEGLMLTNHHCAYDAIQQFSTPTNNYLQDGFWAMNRSEEKNVPGLTASILVRMEDITQAMLEGTNANMTEEERSQKINENSKKVLQGVAEQGKEGYKVQIKNMFDGNEFYLFVYQVFSDIRLVGAPPSSIGKFGGDTDNWMWPRHTGDFSLLRIYANANNEPAEFSAENKPYVPKHALPISMSGVKEGDFAMIMGFPGRTDRYLTSYGIEEALKLNNPAIIKVRDAKLAVMREEMQKSKKVEIMYASKYAQIANYWKYFIGQSQGLERLNVKGKKEAEENKLRQWAAADASRKQYVGVLDQISAAYQTKSKFVLSQVYLNEALLGAESMVFAYTLHSTISQMPNAIDAKGNISAEMVERLKIIGESYFAEMDETTDKKLFATVMKLYSEDVPKDQQSKEFKDLVAKYKGNFNKMAEDAYKKSPLASLNNLNAFLKKPSVKVLEKDLIYVIFTSSLNHYRQNVAPQMQAANAQMQRATRLFVAGLREMNTDKKYAPNANSTIRLTYGTVEGYDARDAVHYSYMTTLEGVFEKENEKDSLNFFYVPKKLKELYKAKDYGQYAVNGTVPVGFLTNTDITGGNSGSPVINAKGQLIGCAFDGNWEAMSGDIAFEPDLQRTISVDIRYVLFIIDKFAGAGHLIKEMELVKE
jgi:hypothetical protein